MKPGNFKLLLNIQGFFLYLSPWIIKVSETILQGRTAPLSGPKFPQLIRRNNHRWKGSKTTRKTLPWSKIAAFFWSWHQWKWSKIWQKTSIRKNTPLFHENTPLFHFFFHSDFLIFFCFFWPLCSQNQTTFSFFHSAGKLTGELCQNLQKLREILFVLLWNFHVSVAVQISAYLCHFRVLP